MENDHERMLHGDTIIAAAQRYIHRGWSVIPIPHRSKKTTSKGWQQWRIKLEELDQWFPADKPWNIGVLTFDLIQQWFGYALVGDTSQQKMLLIVGPRRSGKGTIARVLTQIVGPENVCGPTTSSLAGPFGLQPLIGKSLAIVSDARFSGEGISTVIERLLCISGEDQLTVDRKNIGSVTLKLPTRFMFLTNEFPRLTDASGALAGRFVILRLTQSFYGREDPGLTQRLSSLLARCRSVSAFDFRYEICVCSSRLLLSSSSSSILTCSS